MNKKYFKEAGQLLAGYAAMLGTVALVVLIAVGGNILWDLAASKIARALLFCIGGFSIVRFIKNIWHTSMWDLTSNPEENLIQKIIKFLISIVFPGSLAYFCHFFIRYLGGY